jgi:hypothetical protein
MIIIAAKCQTKEAAAQQFDLAPRIDFKELDKSGIQTEEDVFDHQRQKVTMTHPFHRPLRNGDNPRYIRWMWNPVTGEMLTNTGSGQHAEMHFNWKRRQQETGQLHPAAAQFDSWLRGFYIPGGKDPKTKKKVGPQVGIRPYQWGDGKPEDAYSKQVEHAYNRQNDRVQRHFMEMMKRDMGKKVEFVPNVHNEWLQDHPLLGGQTRW